MRQRIKQLFPLLAMTVLLLMAWPPADVMAEELNSDVPVAGQINAKKTEVSPSSGNRETPAAPSVVRKNASAGAVTKTGDTSDLDLWLVVTTASLLVVILMLLFRENYNTKLSQYSEIHFQDKL